FLGRYRGLKAQLPGPGPGSYSGSRGGGGFRSTLYVCEGQGEGERRAFAHFALDGHLPAVRLDDALDDVEAQPEPLLARAGVLHVADLVEPVEDLLDVRRGNARAVVLHRDQDEAGPRLGRDDDPAAVAAMSLGVAQQIRQDLQDALAVSQHRRR